MKLDSSKLLAHRAQKVSFNCILNLCALLFCIFFLSGFGKLSWKTSAELTVKILGRAQAPQNLC